MTAHVPRSMMAGLALLGLSTIFGCSRAKQEAVLKANEGDNLVQGDKAAAIEKYDEATRLDPTNHHIWYKLAKAYEKKEDWDKMADALQQAIKADDAVQEDGTYAIYYLKLGYARTRIAQTKKDPKSRTEAWEESKAPLQKCIEFDENLSDCYHLLGHAYLWTDDEEKALQYFSDAIAHDPDQIDYYTSLAELYLNLLHYEHGEKVVEAAKGRGKGTPKEVWKLHNMAADILYQKGDKQGMVRELEAAKALDLGDDAQQNILILYNIGITYHEVGQTQKAIENLKGFEVRCKGMIATQFPDECDDSKARLAQLQAPE